MAGKLSDKAADGGGDDAPGGSVRPSKNRRSVAWRSSEPWRTKRIAAESGVALKSPHKIRAQAAPAGVCLVQKRGKRWSKY
jgi:hypothetical protein